ncbi:MAG: HEAT repeat domain-containing protein [Candidatus Heimdallarchaeota archaeon]|nr:HEAT repeat domain-containing protein [Candidatus Heimdallarchaeota archaeon]
MDKYSQEVLIALTSNNYAKAVEKYLLSYDIFNWKIFTENYYKLTPFEAERIIDIIVKKMDIHMIIDILSLSHIIGQSIALSNSIIEKFAKVNLKDYDDLLSEKINTLLDSQIAEKRRIGLFAAGYLNKNEFYDKIEKMSNYDILFEDAYYSLGLMTDKKIVEALGNKFMTLNNNFIQQAAIAKILAKKGNPLAALWLYRNKEFDFTTPYTKAIYLARELCWAGIKPALFLSSNDDFIQPITIKFVEVISTIFIYDIDLIAEIELEKTVRKMLDMLNNDLSIDLLKAIYAVKIAVDDIYHNYDPYSIKREIRTNIINSWKQLKAFPNENIVNYLSSYVKISLSTKSEDFVLALRIIRNFKLTEYEQSIIELLKKEKLTKEQKFEVISCLGQIGGESSVDYILDLLTQEIDLKKRIFSNQNEENLLSEIDYVDDFDNELIISLNQTFELDILKWFNTDFNEIYYWNALFALGNIKSSKGLPVLLKALDDYDPKIRYQAINSIKQLGILDSAVEEKLFEIAQNDQYMSVQKEAIQALGQLDSKVAISFFISTIFKAIEDGILELAGEIDTVYDDRWELDETSLSAEKEEEEEIGTSPKIKDGLTEAADNIIDNDISRWIKRLNQSSSPLVDSKDIELREDMMEFDAELSENIDYLDEEDFSTIYEQGEIEPETQEEEETSEDEEWLSELGEQFKRISIVESAIEALKTTQAEIPLTEVKELIEHPVDEELYKDALIILAKKNNSFAVNELIGLFNSLDFIRAREIVDVLIQSKSNQFNQIRNKAKNTIDWILNEKLASIDN